MVLIGGVTKVGAPSNDVFIFSLSMSTFYSHMIFIFRYTFVLINLFFDLLLIYVTGSKQWTKVNITGEFPKREMHTAVFTGTDIWVYGGKGISLGLLCFPLPHRLSLSSVSSSLSLFFRLDSYSTIR